MKVIVTGGAGYIGSVVAERLLGRGNTVVVLDSLVRGHRMAVPNEAEFIRGDLRDRDWLIRTVADLRPDAVAHLAGEALVGESVTDPAKFFDVNVHGGMNLLDAMVNAEVNRLVFSSTAAVYGEPASVPITEDAARVPVNAYGASKWSFEQMLPWYAAAYGLRHISFRYFNACGATVERGEFHVPETHLIAILLEVAIGLRDEIRLFGDDYETPDGTCIRDYIHVDDLAAAHVDALDYLFSGGASCTLNCGYGRGFSVREVLDMMHRVSGKLFPVTETTRRAGDPAQLVADNTRIREVLHWQPQCDDLELICRTALDWEASYSKR